jgi:putative transposase
VRRSLQRQALRPVYKRPYRVTTDSNHRQPVASNVLARQFDGWAINRAWVCDITYLNTEPPRDSRRLHNLRGWSHEHIEEVFT